MRIGSGARKKCSESRLDERTRTVTIIVRMGTAGGPDNPVRSISFPSAPTSSDLSLLLLPPPSLPPSVPPSIDPKDRSGANRRLPFRNFRPRLASLGDLQRFRAEQIYGKQGEASISRCAGSQFHASARTQNKNSSTGITEQPFAIGDRRFRLDCEFRDASRNQLRVTRIDSRGRNPHVDLTRRRLVNIRRILGYRFALRNLTGRGIIGNITYPSLTI